VTAIPDRRGRLSEGVVVEASVLGRVIGIRLLVLNATIVVVPADVAAPTSPPGDRPGRPSTQAAGIAPPRSGPIGGGLAEAIRSINEGAAILAQARSDDSTRSVARGAGAGGEG
jgi:hypothetical protein